MSKFDEFLEKATVRLPFGWRWARLGDVCAPKTGTCDPRQAPEDTFRYIDISSVDNITKRIIQAKELRGSDAPSRARQIVRQNDVVVATTRPNLNAVAFVPTDLNGAVCSTGFCVLRATDLVEPQFLFAYVQSELS